MEAHERGKQRCSATRTTHGGRDGVVVRVELALAGHGWVVKDAVAHVEGDVA
jgi:hypothetical protein